MFIHKNTKYICLINLSNLWLMVKIKYKNLVIFTIFFNFNNWNLTKSLKKNLLHFLANFHKLKKLLFLTTHKNIGMTHWMEHVIIYTTIYCCLLWFEITKIDNHFGSAFMFMFLKLGNELLSCWFSRKFFKYWILKTCLKWSLIHYYNKVVCLNQIWPS